MARVTESKGNDLVPRQTKTWVMGDGTTNTALKGSLKGRKWSPLVPRRREARRFGVLPAHTPRFQPSPHPSNASPSSSAGPGTGLSCHTSVFAERALGSFGKWLSLSHTSASGAAVTAYTRNIWPEDYSKSDTCLQRKKCWGIHFGHEEISNDI